MEHIWRTGEELGPVSVVPQTRSPGFPPSALLTPPMSLSSRAPGGRSAPMPNLLLLLGLSAN